MNDNLRHPKPCIACKFYAGEPDFMRTPWCVHRHFSVPDAVLGEKAFASLEELRRDPKYCGTEGLLWEDGIAGG